MFRRGYQAAFAVLMLLCIGAVALAAAPAPTTGMVDFEKIQDGYKGTNEAYSRLQTLSDKLSAPITALEAGIGLSEDELATYQRLKTQPVQDTKQIEDLEKKAKANFEEFQDLDAQVQKGETLSDEKKARYDELHKQVYATSAKMNEMNQKAQKEFSAEVQRYQGVIMSTMNDCIAKTAKARNLTMVVSKNVQTEKGVERFVLWADPSVDITDQVLKALNDSYKPDMFDAATDAAK